MIEEGIRDCKHVAAIYFTCSTCKRQICIRCIGEFDYMLGVYCEHCRRLEKTYQEEIINKSF